MHEGDHGIIEDAQSEFEAKFGCGDCQTTCTCGEHTHHDHTHPHDHDHTHSGSDRTVKIIAGVVVVLLAAVFIVFKVIKG